MILPVQFVPIDTLSFSSPFVYWYGCDVKLKPMIDLLLSWNPAMVHVSVLTLLTRPSRRSSYQSYLEDTYTNSPLGIVSSV